VTGGAGRQACFTTTPPAPPQGVLGPWMPDTDDTEGIPMLNNPSHLRYSTQPTGARRRVLATTTVPGVDTQTRTVVTLDDQVARTVAAELNALATSRRTLLHRAGVAAAGEVCHLRRALVATVLGTRRDAAGAAVHALADAVAAVSDAERRAVADEVGRVLEGTEDVIVPVAVLGEYGQAHFLCVANEFLAGADDEVVLALADPDDDGAVLYEGLLTSLRVADDAIEEACVTEWLDVRVDRSVVAAWARRNRPHLAARLDDLAD